MFKNLDFLNDILRISSRSENVTMTALVNILPHNAKSSLLIIFNQGIISYIRCHTKTGVPVLSIWLI